MNLFLDATNFNGNGLFSVPNDIYHSLQPYLKVNKYANNGDLTAQHIYTPKDRSNFAIGIPFCEDDTFQAGMHTGGTVQDQAFSLACIPLIQQRYTSKIAFLN